ncbi:MAG: hypothetical protein JJ902_04085 [Roseibium sp.]|nr:hypothetical protein [Roseibium sp.]
MKHDQTKKIPIVHDPDAPVIFCDGLSGAFVQSGCIHLQLDSVQSDYSDPRDAGEISAEPRNVRKTAVTLIMPLGAAQGLSQAVLDMMRPIQGKA